MKTTAGDAAILFLAQGLGSGRIPWAPGTFGSLLGIGWTWLLLTTGSLAWYLAGTVFLLALAVWICGEAERILGRHDPGSVVLDEIAALPVCFGPLAIMEFILHGGLHPIEHFGGRAVGGMLFTGFGLFRLFDIWKPGPIRIAQRLPRGLGVVADDFFAALTVAILLPWVALGLQRLLS